MFQASKCLRKSVISVTEDFSRKTRESRQELRKFMRHVKKTNPEKRCHLQYDKLYIDGKIFLYNEMSGDDDLMMIMMMMKKMMIMMSGLVEEMGNSQGNSSRYPYPLKIFGPVSSGRVETYNYIFVKVEPDAE